MRVGIVPTLDRNVGGVYQYSVTLIDALRDLSDSYHITLFVRVGEGLPPELQDVPFEVIELRLIGGKTGELWAGISRFLPKRGRAFLRHTISRLKGAPAQTPGTTNAPDTLWANWFEKFDLDLVVFADHSDLCAATGVPFVVAVHDIQHRLQPEFPEVSADGEWQRREDVISRCVLNAVLVLVDSEVGREDMIDCYGPLGLDAEAVFALPFLPASYLAGVEHGAVEQVKKKYALPSDYLFYPAQFWPHKNHRRLVEALSVLKEQDVDVKLVLTGGHSGALREDTFSEMLRRGRELGVESQIVYLGYVSDDEMAALFAGAQALVMPTFFGPTNIPVLEAWRFGCPVVTSDIRGIREQVGDAAILVDPRSSESIAAGIRQLILTPDLPEALADRGRERLASYSRSDFVALLASALVKARERLERIR